MRRRSVIGLAVVMMSLASAIFGHSIARAEEPGCQDWLSGIRQVRQQVAQFLPQYNAATQDQRSEFDQAMVSAMGPGVQRIPQNATTSLGIKVNSNLRAAIGS